MILSSRQRPAGIGTLLRAALGLVLIAATSACVTDPGPRPDTAQHPIAKQPVTASAEAPPASTPPAASPDPLAASNLMKDVRFLASATLRGREAGTPDEVAAADYLARSLDALKLDEVGAPGVRKHPFAIGSRRSENVVGIIPAPNAPASNPTSYVVLGAHYDHLGQREGKTFFGADDNASGVAAVLGIARALNERKSELGRPILIAFFGAEEVGMLGSTAFLRDAVVPRTSIAFMVNVDMIGRPLGDKPLHRLAAVGLGIDPEESVAVDGLHNRPELERVARAASEKHRHRLVTVEDLPGILQPVVKELSRGRGDNWPFEREGISSLFFSSIESSDYHQATDTVETLDEKLIEVRARLILDTVIGLSKLAAPSAPP